MDQRQSGFANTATAAPDSPRRLDGELFNVSTHLIALLASALGAAALWSSALSQPGLLKLVAASVFTATLLAVYATSVLYHWSCGAAKRRWQQADHVAIHLLIAGSFTPFAIGRSPGATDWMALIAMWSLAAWGAARALQANSSQRADLHFYLAMGWLALLIAIPAALERSALTLAWLLAGGLAYSLGTLYYRNPERYVHSHGIWHLFVFAGSSCHLASVFLLLN